MTIVSPNLRRGASLAVGGMFITASTLLISAPLVSAAPSTEAVDAINSRYTTFGGEGSLLGAPTGDAVDVPGGAAREYQGGTIYYSKDTGAHVMYGVINDRYKTLGGPGSDLGFPKNDESDTGDGTGRFNDFSAPEGASIYWTPQWGASVIKGKVLEAWRQSGGVTGPFGYPSADTSIADGVQTGKFVGPDGTEIQWSQAAGLVTIPAALAAKIPGFGTATPTAEGTTSVTKPTLSTPAAPETSAKNSKWWWIPVGLAALALLAGLARLLRRKPEPAPVKVAAPAPVKKVVPPPPPPAPKPVAKVTPPPAPPAPPRPAPAKVVPLAKTPPPAPKPVTPPPPPPPPAPRPIEVPKIEVPKIEVPKVEVPKPDVAKATIHTASVEQDVSPVIKYASTTPADTTIKVTYENNAVDGKASTADKSDLTPDHLQE